METTQRTVEGARVWCARRDGARQAGSNPIFTGGIYEACRRADGMLIWRVVDGFGGTRSGKYGPSKKYMAELIEAAPAGMPHLNVRQHMACA